MDMNEILVFVKVLQTGSFTAAAQALQMPKSTVSSKVSELESRLGVTLIQRTTRKLHVTPAGQAFYEKALQGLEFFESAEQELLQSKGEPRGVLKITAPVELGVSILPEVVAAYARKFPAVKVEVILSDRSVDLLGEGIDLAIRAGSLADSTLIAKKLGSVQFAPFASPAYLKLRGKPAHPKEFSQHSIIGFTPLSHQGMKLTNGKTTVSVSLDTRLLISDLSMVRALACSGEGIAMLPTFYCRQEVKNSKLERVLPS